jgi:hypothetical protein
VLERERRIDRQAQPALDQLRAFLAVQCAQVALVDLQRHRIEHAHRFAIGTEARTQGVVPVQQLLQRRAQGRDVEHAAKMHARGLVESQ